MLVAVSQVVAIKTTVVHKAGAGSEVNGADDGLDILSFWRDKGQV